MCHVYIYIKFKHYLAVFWEPVSGDFRLLWLSIIDENGMENIVGNLSHLIHGPWACIENLWFYNKKKKRYKKKIPPHDKTTHIIWILSSVQNIENQIESISLSSHMS